MSRFSAILGMLLAGLPACSGDWTSAATASEGIIPDETGEPVPGICTPDADPEPDPFVDCVEDFVPAAGASFGHDLLPDVVKGPPLGGGDAAGSQDVVSLGCGGSITVAFSGPGIGDGPGPDFIVFENPFVVGEETFSEPAWVGASEDGENWAWFPCLLDGMGTWPPTGCAGIETVHAAPDNTIDPTDPDKAGGDAFDLADLGVGRARYVRFLDATVEYYGDELWCAGPSGGFDLDAVAVIHEAE